MRKTSSIFVWYPLKTRDAGYPTFNLEYQIKNHHSIYTYVFIFRCLHTTLTVSYLLYIVNYFNRILCIGDIHHLFYTI